MEKIIKLSKQSAELQAPLSPRKELRDIKPFSNFKSVPKSFGSSQIKDLTLKQAKDFIEELYETKLKYDLKCIENHQTKETLDQYMQSYLYKKYGLKSITNDWVSAVNKAITKYSNDADINLFGKILNNAIDEDFQLVLKQVREKALELLKSHLKVKFPYMQEKAVKDLVIEKSNGDLEEDEWISIVSGLYTHNDAEYLQEILSQNSSPTLNTSKNKRRKVLFSKLIQVIQEFQVAGYEAYLKPITEL